MQKFFRNAVFFILRLCIKFKLWRIKPKIIGITGSFAKTSTRDAAYLILSSKYKVRKNRHGFNTEYGICLDLLDIDFTGKIEGKHSVKRWTKVLLRAIWNSLFSKEKFDILLLEIGLDRPGDMDLILKFLKADIQVITSITLNHVEFGFKTQEDIWNEKKKLVYGLKADATAILNRDDEFVSRAISDLKSKVFTFSERHKDSDLYSEVIKSDLDGLEITFHHKNEKQTSSFNILGAYHSLILNSALSIALTVGMGLKESLDILEKFELPEGRMSRITGINNSVILDSSYNASPKTSTSALGLLKSISAARKIAALGSMAELGDYTVDKHLEIGSKASENCDILIAIGPNSVDYIKGWKDCGKAFFEFQNSELAAAFLKDFVKEGDLILVKGSHFNDMDLIVEELRAEN